MEWLLEVTFSYQFIFHIWKKTWYAFFWINIWWVMFPEDLKNIVSYAFSKMKETNELNLSINHDAIHEFFFFCVTNVIDAELLYTALSKQSRTMTVWSTTQTQQSKMNGSLDPMLHYSKSLRVKISHFQKGLSIFALKTFWSFLTGSKWPIY